MIVSSVQDDAVNMLPRWARWLDAIVVLCVLVSVAAALSPARVRLDVGLGVVSLGSPWRPFLLAAVLFGVRHWLVPRPHLGQRIAAWARALGSPPFVLSARMLLATRLPILVAGFAATLIIGLPQAVARQMSEKPLRHLPARWDAMWYVEIAREGYRYDPRLGPDEQQRIVFFPLYPMLMRTVAAFTTPDRTPMMTYGEYLELRQVRLAWSGLFISLVAFFGALIVVYRWAELHAGAEAAAATVVLLSAYPFAVYFSAPYTESLFLLLVTGACYAFERGRLTIAGAAGLLAGLTRPNGAMLSLLLAILALTHVRRREPGWIRRTSGGLLAAAMPGVGMLLYSAFVYGLTGKPFTWIEAQAAWGRGADLTAQHFAWIVRTIANEGVFAYIRALPAEVVQLSAVVFSLALVWPVWRRIGPAYAVFILVNLLPPMIQGGMLSLGRFTATLFPLFLALALLLPPERRTSWIIAFGIGQGLIAAVFFTWRPIY
jgi:hypothetical protein